MEIKSNEISIVNIEELIPYSRNSNKHPEAQIERLCKIIEYQGFRNPLIVQKGTNIIAAGHGRFEAAKKLGYKKLPVIYQEFENEAQFFAYTVADNAIAEWAELDKNLILEEIELLDLDIDLLGIKNFEIPEILEPEDLSDKNKEIDTDNFGNDLEHTCPKCGFEFNE